MDITFDDYIKNPMGKGAANNANKDMYKQFYSSELDKLLLKEGGKISYNLYINRDMYYIHFRIPDAKLDKFYYDVVIEFYTKDNALKVTRDLNKYCVNFFSNDPSFTFTWCYAFNKEDLIIDDLKSKCSRLALTKAPDIRNPNYEVGYNKFLYYAYLLIRLYGLFDKTKFETVAKPYSTLKAAIVNAQDIPQLRKDEAEKQKKRDKKMSVKPVKITATSNEMITRNSKFINKVSTTKTVGTQNKPMKTIRNSKLVKKI